MLLLLDELEWIKMANNFHFRWSTCPLPCNSDISLGDIWPPANLLSSCCSCWQQDKATGGSPVKANLYELGISPSNPLCNLHRNRAFFLAAVDIELNVGESRDITALRRTSHHWPASYYSWRSHDCRSESSIDKDNGNPAEYSRHGEITEDNINKSATCNSDNSGQAPKGRRCLVKNIWWYYSLHDIHN